MEKARSFNKILNRKIISYQIELWVKLLLTGCNKKNDNPDIEQAKIM